MKFKLMVMMILACGSLMADQSGSRPVFTDGTNFWATTQGLTNLLNIGSAVVPTNAPSTGDMLRYDGANWVATSGYVDSGNGTAFHYTALTFTNGAYATWRDLDLSTDESSNDLVPDGAKSVDITVIIQDNTAGQYLDIRTKGDTGIFNRLSTWTQVANVITSVSGTVGVDENIKVQFRLSSGLSNASIIGLNVTGWNY